MRNVALGERQSRAEDRATRPPETEGRDLSAPLPEPTAPLAPRFGASPFSPRKYVRGECRSRNPRAGGCVSLDVAGVVPLFRRVRLCERGRESGGLVGGDFERGDVVEWGCNE